MEREIEGNGKKEGGTEDREEEEEREHRAAVQILHGRKLDGLIG